MKKKWIGLFAGAAALAALTSGIVLAACDDEQQGGPIDGQVAYTVSVKSVGGAGIGDALVSVYGKGNKPLRQGRTDKNGDLVVYLEPGTYELKVAGLPAGYTLSEDNTFALSATSYETTVNALSTVIASEAPADKVYAVGDVMYDFTIQARVWDSEDSQLKTQLLSLSTLLGQKKAVVLNFWATWCTPCAAEFPAIDNAYPDYADDIAFIAIDGDVTDTNNKMDKFFQDNLGSYPSFAYGLAPEVKQHFSMSGIPTTVCIDRYGVVCYQDTGSQTSDAVWRRLFARWSADDYVQDFTTDDVNGDGASSFLPPSAGNPPPEEQSNNLLKRVNDNSYPFGYYGEHNTEDAEYSWPWNILETVEDGYYLFPTNSTYDNTFATIYSDFTTTEDYDTLVFEYKTSCEAYDVLYVIIDDMVMWQFSGVMSEWKTCYAYVSKDHVTTHRLGLLWVKDREGKEGDDTVKIRNVRLAHHDEIASAGPADGIDLPRYTSWGTKTDGKYNHYADVALRDDGYYHIDAEEYNSETEPYLFADLFNATNFSGKSISDYAVDGAFKYADRDDTDAITEYLMVANNSALPGLIPVNAQLQALLDRFCEHMSADYHGQQWLQICMYFDHYGNGKGLTDADRNPVLGLSYATAYDAFDIFHDGGSEEDPYLNYVTVDRLIVPRGIKYKFVPQESGVYRIETQPGIYVGDSEEDDEKDEWIGTAGDTLSWIFIRSAAEPLYSSDNMREDAAQSTCRMTYYMDAGQEYYLAFAFADFYVEGTFTFTVKHLGENYDLWSHAAPGFYTFDEFSEDFKILVPGYVHPVRGNDGFYYNAKKDAEGNYLLNAKGEYEADTSTPIYIDFLHTTYLLDLVALDQLLDPKNENDVARAESFKSIIGQEDYDNLKKYLPVAKDGSLGPCPGESLDQLSPYYGFVKANQEIVNILTRMAEHEGYGFAGVSNQWLMMAYYFEHLGPRA